MFVIKCSRLLQNNNLHIELVRYVFMLSIEGFCNVFLSGLYYMYSIITCIVS